MLKDGGENRKNREIFNAVLRGGFGSSRDRIYSASRSKSSSFKYASLIGYIIAAAFLFATIALLFSLASEVGKFVENADGKSAVEQSHSVEVVFRPKVSAPLEKAGSTDIGHAAGGLKMATPEKK